MKMIVFLFTILLFSKPISATETIKIEIGDDYKTYSMSDLKRRVWNLEKAVWQLQEKIKFLEENNSQQGASWICTITSMGNTFTAVGVSEAVAIHNVTQKCKDENKGDGFFCKNPACKK